MPIIQRTKHQLVVGITILPIISFMRIISLTSFQPLFRGREKIVNLGYGQIRPLHLAEENHQSIPDRRADRNIKSPGLEKAFNRLSQYRLTDPPVGYSMLLLDIDKFKSINDRFGHDAGGMALKTVAATAGKMIRHKDVFGRFGGEALVILPPETTVEEARLLSERIREGIASPPIELPGHASPIRITVSIGCAASATGADGVDSVLKAADRPCTRPRPMDGTEWCAREKTDRFR